MLSSKQVGLPILVFVMLLMLSGEDSMVGTRLPEPHTLPEPQTLPPYSPPETTTLLPYHTSPNHSILFHAQSRFTSEITNNMFKAKQQVLNLLCVGEFDENNLTADGFVHSSPQAKALYSKWNNQSRTNECIANRRMFLVGTSFQRSILWSLLRRLMGGLEQVPIEYRLISSVPALIREKDPNTGKCDTNVNGTRYEIQPVPWNTSVPSCLLVKNKNCEHPGRT
ncbi:hypothetical protein BASA81_007761 [Batrachochytrium salamandrivorans]|nr:hypothetical protein BASA81_007761 [Batrachochytrium salamandrivorans]